MYEINERKEIAISRRDANFDRAADSAIAYALMIFGVDEDGHMENVKNSERSTDAIIIDFCSYRIGMGMNGQFHTYTFEARVERHEL